MKFFAVFFFALALIACAFASPIEEDQEGKPIVLSRVRRVTCDILSVSTPIGSLNHAACAAHCLSMGRGFRGGRCIDGVCNCRR